MGDKRIKVVVAKPGLDGHDRGAKVVAIALKEAGMEVIYTGLHQSIEAIVETAIQEDVDVLGLRDTVDPLAGSYFIETITKQMEEKIWEEMKEIEERGGMLASVKDGHVGRKLARQAYEWEMGIEHGELDVFGPYLEPNVI